MPIAINYTNMYSCFTAAIQNGRWSMVREDDLAEIEYLLECANRDEITEMLKDLKINYKPLHR